MPAKSQQQQKFMGLVHAYKKGEVPASKVSKAVKDAAKSMSNKSVKKYAKTKHDELPKKVTEKKERDYKAEYKKFQSSTKAKKYRAELNKYNRQKGTYGNGDGKDASHKGGKIVGFEAQSKNRGRREKSRLKKEGLNERAWTPAQEKAVKELDKKFYKVIGKKGIEPYSYEASQMWTSGGFRKEMRKIFGKDESVNEQQYFDPKGKLKKYMDKVLKQAGIRVITYDPMKQSFYNGIWGGFYTVASSNKVDMPGQGKVKRSSAVLPVYIDKKSQIELGVSGDGFKLGKAGSSQVLKNLKDFKKGDLEEGLVKEGTIEQRELKLYIDNDGQLYRQRYTPIEKNLTKKMEKGKYDSKLAVKLFMYLVDDGAKKYVKDFGGNVRDMFPKKDRIEVAKELRDDFEAEYKVRNESYDIWVEDGSFGGTFTGLLEAEYQGRKVKLNKPMQGDSKKFKVYVKNDKGNVVKVNFGQGGDAKGGTMRIRKSNPKARANFRARHNCDNPGPRHKARYWSCKKW